MSISEVASLQAKEKIRHRWSHFIWCHLLHPNSLSVSPALTVPLALPRKVARASRFSCLHIGPNIDHGNNMTYILKQLPYACCPLERYKYLLITSSATYPTPSFLSSYIPSPFAVFLSCWILSLLKLPMSSESQLWFEQLLTTCFSSCEGVFCHSLPRLSLPTLHLYCLSWAVYWMKLQEKLLPLPVKPTTSIEDHL